MRRLVVNTLALAVVLTGARIVLGQPAGAPPKRKVVRVEEEEDAKAKTTPSKSKLEEMLAEALKNNPDIRVAAANVTLAEAELNRTRLQVTQKIATLYHAIDAQKVVVEHQETKFKAMQKQATRIPGVDLESAKLTLTQAKAKLTELESQMPALLGKTSHDADAAVQALQRLQRMAQEQFKAQGPLTDKIRKALETPITVNYKDVKFSEVLKDLEKKASGLSFHVRDLSQELNPKTGVPAESSVTLHFDTPLPIAAILQAIEDKVGSHFIVRDYGILVTTGKLPPGALTVQDFMRQKPADAPHEKAELRNPPPYDDVEGIVKQVDSSGLMTISIGSDAGLSKGHTLELFRLGEKPSESKYLGTIRILEVGPKEAVAQPVGRLAARPKAGDKVASRIPEK